MATTTYSSTGQILNPALVPNPVTDVGSATAQAIAAGNTAYSQLPGYAGDIAGEGANISSEIAGQLPESVLQQIQQQGAERGVSTGSPGSPNSNASYLQALGLNSLNLTNTGQQNLSAATAALPGAAISQNPGFYVNPALQQSADTTNAASTNAANTQNAALAAAQLGASQGAGGPTTTTTNQPNLTPQTKTPTTQPSNPYYAPPQVGWSPYAVGSGIPANNRTGNLSDIPGDTISSVQNIIDSYASTVDPANEASGIYMGPNYSGGNVDTNSGENDYSYAGGGGDYYGGDSYDSGD